MSIASFKIRQGDPVGVAVTLRGDRMWDFFDKLISIALPQVKDFSGVSRTAFDQAGNYSLGLTEQIIFPEIVYDEIDRVRGLQIVMTIRNADSREESFELLEKPGMPFKKDIKQMAKKSRIVVTEVTIPSLWRIVVSFVADLAGTTVTLVCAVCLRELAHKGELPGVVKSSLICI